jgi:hypothetical protein
VLHNQVGTADVDEKENTVFISLRLRNEVVKRNHTKVVQEYERHLFIEPLRGKARCGRTYRRLGK